MAIFVFAFRLQVLLKISVRLFTVFTILPSVIYVQTSSKVVVRQVEPTTRRTAFVRVTKYAATYLVLKSEFIIFTRPHSRRPSLCV